MKMDDDEGYNKELHSIYKEPVIKDTARLRRAGHVVRMNDQKKIVTNNPGGQRGRGRPKLRWLGGGRRKKVWVPKLEDSGTR
jgi:hypothetical protein